MSENGPSFIFVDREFKALSRRSGYEHQMPIINHVQPIRIFKLITVNIL